MKNFKINNYLVLKFDDFSEKTIIFVAGERFRQCKFLLLNISVNKIKLMEEIESIDKAAELLDKTLEKPIEEGKNYIDPKVEYWAHCSNLQVWYENNYDTRILHRNLAFPLLGALSKAGDPIAKRVFKEEIAKRLASGNGTVTKYLLNQRLAYLLDHEQYLMSVLKPEEADAILNLEKFTGKYISQDVDWEDFNLGIDEINERYQRFLARNKSVIGLVIYWFDKPAKILLEKIVNLKKLKVFRYVGENIDSLPNSFYKLKDLRTLTLESDTLDTFPSVITKLSNLEDLNIRSYFLNSIPFNIGDMKKLKKLSIGNKIEDLPESISELKKLEYLSLNNNLFTQIPEQVFSLESLKGLFAVSNKIKTISSSIGKIETLETLHLRNNKIEILPENLENLENLKTLSIEENYLADSSKNILEKLKKKGVKINLY